MAAVERVVGSNTVLLLFDEHIGKNGNYTDLKNEFESNTGTNMYAHHDVENCRRFIRRIKNRKPFCIIQGKHAKELVPDIIQYTKSPVVYIFCENMFALTEWAQDIPCILQGGIFNHEKDLLTKLTVDLADYASLKSEEYRIKRQACQEWAEHVTNNAKRLKNDQCTLTFREDPFDNQETSGVETI